GRWSRCAATRSSPRQSGTLSKIPSTSTRMASSSPPPAAWASHLATGGEGRRFACSQHMKRLVIPAAFCVFFAHHASAQTLPSFDRVLVPLQPGIGVPGAFGSLWRTDLAVANLSDAPVIVTGVRCGSVECVPTALPPYASAAITNLAGCDEVRGVF